MGDQDKSNGGVQFGDVGGDAANRDLLGPAKNPQRVGAWRNVVEAKLSARRDGRARHELAHRVQVTVDVPVDSITELPWTAGRNGNHTRLAWTGPERREAGREPMPIRSMTSMGVACRKYSTNCGCT